MMRALLCLVCLALATHAEGGLPVVGGLLFHADAAAQSRERGRAGLPPIGNLQPVDLFLGGTNAWFSQTAPERRPALVTDSQSAFLKFDGKDDFLGMQTPGRSARDMTFFILAAPRENAGFFSGLIGAASFGRNDYTSGINFDFGPAPTTNLSVLNVESAGAGGFRDLLTPGFLNAADRPFADFHVFTARSRPGTNGVEVFLDGFKGGERERTESVIGLEQWVLGGRFYSNDANQPPFAQGVFSGAIAEIAVYDRAVTDAERGAIEQAMLAKIAGLNALLRGATGHALEPVKDPPVVQMFVPGFAAEELPLKIGNLNNVRYRHDGKVVAQGYDGRIQILTDSDGDGLEDRAEIFWGERTLQSPIGIELLPKDDSRGEGVFVASKGKVSLILDKDRDGRADEEKIIASGWPQPFHSVDCMGLAVDPKDGSIYFGRGCANFVEAYLVDKTTGKSRYRLEDEQGTIQRISPDFSKREIVCTGVRFTCALAFNGKGDLFASDQEGATWLPNGNPFDELLHIERGKHYGFPPRHPRHLPGVIDEPAVFEYGPQHQSTVGLIFNEGVNGGPHFGPAHWKGDAILCGESRGKLYRTKLAKTSLGYVAVNHLIGSVAMLAVDSCVTPAGGLLLACHSGPPDWGTGPAGEGRIFKISYRERELPQPVHAWAAAPDEFRIAFDKPLDPADWAKAREQVRIEAGEHVAAGDRFEAIRPGYQVVRDQMASMRRWVELLGLSLSEDRRTIVLRVPRQTEPANYAIALPLPERWPRSSPIAQHPWIDVALTLNGVAAKMGDRRIILPHPSLAASAELMRGSAEHEAFLKAAAEPGAKIELHTLVNTANPFVPAVQPGSTLDWDPAQDEFASKEFEVGAETGGDWRVESADAKTGSFRETKVVADGSTLSGEGLFLADGALRRRLAPSSLRTPWAAGSLAPTAAPAVLRTAADGNWLRGRRLYFGDAGCGSCHTVRGEGTAFGPDLSNLVHRDRDSVLQDIKQPSASINPDHTGSLATLDDGTELAGVVRAQTDAQIVLAMPGGVLLELPRARLKSIEPMKTSIMPAGIDQQLSAEQLEDLLTFLLLDSPQPAPITRTDPPMPPARSKAELARVLGEFAPPPNPKPLRVLLAAGPKDHGPDEHDYPLWLERWSRLLELGENLSVSTSMGFPAEDLLAAADVAVFYNANPGWDAQKAAALDAYHKRGGGALYIHYAVDGGKDPAAAAERIGLAFTLGSKFRHGDFDLVFSQPDHPITRGFPTLHFTDETYWGMRGETSRLNVLGSALEDEGPRPQLWTLEREKSRIVGCIPGHYTWTFDDPLFRVLVLRSICWAAREENVDRLAELATVGARMAP